MSDDPIDRHKFFHDFASSLYMMRRACLTQLIAKPEELVELRVHPWLMRELTRTMPPMYADQRWCMTGELQIAGIKVIEDAGKA